MSTVVLHPQASAEVTEAARQYEDQATGLGDDFLIAVMHQRRHPGYWRERTP